MARLNPEALEPCKVFRITELELLDGVSMADLKKLQRAEKRLREEGSDYGLPYHVALQYHMQGTSLTKLDRKYGVQGGTIGSMLMYFGFQRLSLSEAIGRGRKAAFPLTTEDRRSILKVYDKVAASFESEEKIVDAISKETGLEKKSVGEFLARQKLK